MIKNKVMDCRGWKKQDILLWSSRQYDVIDYDGKDTLSVLKARGSENA